MASVDNYEVFINFRGADTRHSFVKILYDELVAEGIRVFLDDEELNHGKRLDEELPQAINNSKIYITVISQTYASSKWCLRELAEIVKNKQQFKEKKEILPIFYKITVEDVKLKTSLFKDQLNSLLERNVGAKTVEEWAVTLKGIPDLKAWKVPIDGGYKEDAECCREIVKRTSVILRVKHKPLPNKLIGMEDPVEEMIQLLDIGKPGLLVIGIHGMGGSGKTTLAKAVYNKLCDDEFDCCCFLRDVRESLDKDKGSRRCLELQKKILKEVSYSGDDEIRDVDEAIRRIQLTLQGKKVLMVFDDVSKSKQIVSLIGNNDNIKMFKGGSRIIITTRDDRVLKNIEFAEFIKIHEMKAMENKHALELFSWHAFGKETPPKDSFVLSYDVVTLTGRLPLSLEIVGSLFYVGGKKNWKKIVEKLKKMPNEEVQERLKISYEDLDEQTREIFLDIACFFVDKARSHEFHMWDACDFFPELAIEELISMCLIKIEDYGIYGTIYKMHDSIKDLGREIVRKEGPKDMEQRTRIWNKIDAVDILTATKKKKNNKIEGVLLEYNPEDYEILTLRGENCVNLNMLRFLHFEGSMPCEVQLEGSFKHCLPKLRFLSLEGMKMNLFNATDFNLKKLIVLNFSHSDITESWPAWNNEFKDLPNLEVLNLSYCHGLKKTHDLSYYMSLKTLSFRYCSELEEIDSSITSLPNLQHLDFAYCSELKRLPDSIGELVELEVLLLVRCIALVSLPNSLTSLPKLGILNVSDCNNLESLPDSIGEMIQLRELNISGSALKKLPRFLSKQKRLEVLLADWVQIQEVPIEIEELHCLREISFSLSSICGLPSLVKLSRLEKLSLMGCDHIKQLPAELPTSLVELYVSSNSLQRILDYSYLSNLTDLRLDICEPPGVELFDENGVLIGYAVKEDTRELRELNVNWIWRLSKLKKLQLNMPKTYPTSIQIEESSSVSLFSQLEELTLRCLVLGTCVIPSFLSALSTLDIQVFRGTTSLSLPRLNRLTHFILSYSDDLAQILGLGELESLVTLEIMRCNSLERLDDISMLRQLVTLDICYCKKLRVISVVPCQPSLKKVEITGCESLESLVGHSDLESCLYDLNQVEGLNIFECPLLEMKLES